MDVRLLEACRENLAREIAPHLLLLDISIPSPERCELLVEHAGVDRRRARMAVDMAQDRACLYLARPSGASSTETPIRRLLIGCRVINVDRPAPTPVLRLVLAEPSRGAPSSWLVFEWLGGRPAWLLVDANTQEVLFCSTEPHGPHARRRSKGSLYQWPEPPHRPPYARAGGEQVRAALASGPESDPARALTRGFAGLPTFLAREALHRAGSDPQAIATTLREIAAEPFRPILYKGVEPGLNIPAAFVSPVPLLSLAQYEDTHPRSLFGLLAQAQEICLRSEGADRMRIAYLRLLDQEEKRLMRLHARLLVESREADRAPELRRMAEALLSHFKEVPRRARVFRCPDPHEQDRVLEIPLDPALSPSANSDALFRRARRLGRGGPPRKKRMDAAERAVAEISSLREHARSDQAWIARDGIRSLRAAIGSLVRDQVLADWERRNIAGAADPERNATRTVRRVGPARLHREDRFHPRIYRVGDGWTILVGRTNEENDYITHFLAKPEDYWFHASGCPGSHVIMRREGRKDNPSARTIEEAAAIAAYFSKARTSRKAPVVYTLRKYVRKPRGGAAGLALITRERTIMIEPKAPAASTGTDED